MPQLSIARARPEENERGAGRYRRLRAAFALRNVSAIYIGIGLFLVFALIEPDSFLRVTTWQALLDSQTVTAIAAVGLVLPVAAGAFDLAIGAEVGFGAIMVAWLIADKHMNMVLAAVIGLAVGAASGLASGIFITRFRIDSFIATLGVSSILLALVSWISGDQQILNIAPSFSELGLTKFLGVTTSVWIMLVVAVVLWYVLEQTAWGRRVYATGGNIDAARLAGVRTSRVIVVCLTIGGFAAALAGVISTSRLGDGDPTIGPPYLLPAFTAVFLGSTQFRGGRFNVWGTLMATYVLAIGVKGLQLSGAPVWVPDLFNGAALLLAVALAKRIGKPGRPHPLMKLLRLDRARPDSGSDPAAGSA